MKKGETMYPVKNGYLRCYYCKKNKLKRLFNKNKSLERGYHGVCKTCRSLLSKTKYKIVHKEIKKKQRIYYEDMKKRAVEYLGGKCILCKKKYHFCVFDFHHFNPKLKNSVVSKKLNNTFENLKKELDQCELVCSNCHRLKHFEKNRIVAEETDP